MERRNSLYPLYGAPLPLFCTTANGPRLAEHARSFGHRYANADRATMGNITIRAIPSPHSLNGDFVMMDFAQVRPLIETAWRKRLVTVHNVTDTDKRLTKRLADDQAEFFSGAMAALVAAGIIGESAPAAWVLMIMTGRNVLSGK